VRLAAYAKGLASAMPAMPARRAQRSAKLCAFPGEKTDRAHGAKLKQGAFHAPIGNIASPWEGKTGFKLELGCAIAGLRRTATDSPRG